MLLKLIEMCASFVAIFVWGQIALLALGRMFHDERILLGGLVVWAVALANLLFRWCDKYGVFK